MYLVHGCKFSSPSANFTFGAYHHLPFGYSLILWGLPKSGKSFLSYDMIGQLHRDDPQAIAVKFNTEMREQTQFNQRVADEFGIDTDRYIAINDNTPARYF